MAYHVYCSSLVAIRLFICECCRLLQDAFPAFFAFCIFVLKTSTDHSGRLGTAIPMCVCVSATTGFSSWSPLRTCGGVLFLREGGGGEAKNLSIRLRVISNDSLIGSKMGFSLQQPQI
jgi:hypothetical protein